MRAETGMTVRTLVECITGPDIPAGSIGVLDSVEMNDLAGVPPRMCWVRFPHKRSDGVEIGKRAPYYDDEIEVVPSMN